MTNRSSGRAVVLSLALSLCALPRPSPAQSYDQLRVAVHPLPLAVDSSAASQGVFRRECRNWVGWGSVVGAVAGAAYGIAAVTSTKDEGRPLAVLMSPVIVAIPTLAGWAVGSITGYVACRIAHSGDTSFVSQRSANTAQRELDQAEYRRAQAMPSASPVAPDCT